MAFGDGEADNVKAHGRTTVRHGLRQVEVALLAVPMSDNVKEAATQLGRLLD